MTHRLAERFKPTGEAWPTLGVAALAVVLLLVMMLVEPSVCMRDDMLSQYLGASRQVWLAAMHGHVALVTPSSWFGGAIAAEYQHGVFSIFAVATHVFAWSVGRTLPQTAFLLVAVPFASLAAGAYRLARVEGCSPAAALLAALLATFNGWTIRWALPWYPALSSFAWVAWLLWALRRGGRARPHLVAVFTYAIFAGGWPFSLLMTAVSVAWALADEFRRTREARPLAPVIAGALLGICLAAPSLLMLREFGAVCERLQDLAWTDELTVPIGALPGILAPAWRAFWTGVGDEAARPAPELWSGVAIAMIGAALLGRTSRRTFAATTWPWLVLAASALAFACLPGHKPFRWTFRWLPLWHLAIGVAAGRASDSLLAASAFARRVRSMKLVPSLAAVLTALLVLSSPEPDFFLSWGLGEGASSAAPLDPARTYLAMYQQWGGQGPPLALRFGNLPLLADLSFVNGYSPLRPLIVTNTFPLDGHGWFRRLDRAVATIDAAVKGSLLDDLGIDGLVLRDRPGEPMVDALLAHGWSVTALVEGGTVMQKGSTPAPRAWVVDAADHRTRMDSSRSTLTESDHAATLELETSTDRESLVVFKRAAYPGYQATIDGAPASVERYLDMLVAVRVTKGTKGPIAVRYWPGSLTQGLAISGAALVVLLLWLALSSRLRRCGSSSSA